MSTSTHILIAGNQVSLQRNLEPFLLPEGAYPILENAFIFRERVKRRRGFHFLGRLRRHFDEETLDQSTSAGTTTTITDIINDDNIASRAEEPNAEIEPGSLIIIVQDGASPPAEWDDSAQDGTLTAVAGNAAGGTINYFTGEIVLNFTAADTGGNDIDVTFNYFPTLPVMGLRRREVPAINDEETIAFDTKYAYQLTATGWLELVAGTTWNGENFNFFFTTNWRGASASTFLFFASNFFYDSITPVNSNPIRYYDGANWTTFTPAVDSSNFLLNARILLPYKGRLLAFNTIEGDSNDFSGTNDFFRNRLRFSAIGDPTTATSFRSDIPGRGGFIDAPVKEAIVGAAFVKDKIIVYFERSTWELVYTGIETFPFTFKQINPELGSESTFSVLTVEDTPFAVGDTGIHATIEVKRIDIPIPDEVFKIQNLEQGIERVYGIRDYDNELIYWTYPQQDKYSPENENPVYPNRVLVYNYRNNSWAKFIDSFTCYGYEQKNTDYTWDTLPYETWDSWNVPWESGVDQGGYPTVVAGNQQGFTFRFENSSSDDQSLTIEDLSITGTTVTIRSSDHNLTVGQHISFNENILGVSILQTPENINNTTFEVSQIVDENSFTITALLVGSYIGNGRITVHHNFRIATKRFNPFFPNDKQMRLLSVNYLLDNSGDGEFSSEVFINSNTSVPMPTFTPLPQFQGRPNVIKSSPEPGRPIQIDQEKIWHEKKYNVRGETVQLLLTLNQEQMLQKIIADSEFVLHAIQLKVKPGASVVS